jgi:hypothetical protein
LISLKLVELYLDCFDTIFSGFAQVPATI